MSLYIQGLKYQSTGVYGTAGVQPALLIPSDRADKA